jgi:hypothetical protein
MAAQTELECVSCGTDFDPDETGGFCPDCDTPHPDYERGDPGPEAEGDPAEPAASEPADAGAAEADEAEEPEDAEESATDADEAEVEPVDTDADAEEAAADVATDAGEPEEADEELADSEEADEEPPEPEQAEADVAADAEAEPEDAAEAEPEDAPQESGEEPDVVECDNCGHEADPAFSFCPECGEELVFDEPSGLETCPDCGEDVEDAMSFCPNCGFDLEAAREEPDDDEAAVPEEVTLVVNGESYTFGDGDTFGRQDEDWLADLVEASGGRDEVAYVSGEHLTFAVEDDGVYVTDTSANGTDLNGEPLDGGTEKLSDGDELELAGRAEVAVEL